MKSITLHLLVIILSLMIYNVQAQWSQQANFQGTARRGAVCFAIGTDVYIGTGSGDELYKDFWAYDTETNTWIQKADFAGAARWDAVGFAIGTKGYIGTGYTGSTFKKDFWEYDPESDTWTQIANFGGPVRRSAVGFSIGPMGYVGTGYGTPSGTYYHDFWEYDQINNIWSQMADFPGTARDQAVGFSIGLRGYVGTGQDFNDNYYKDFWEYDPANNIWLEKTYFGGTARTGAVGFSIGNKGYIGTGLNGVFPYTEHKDFWVYDPENDTWAQLADFGGEERWEAVSCSAGSKGFLGIGQGSTSYTSDFWEFTPDSGLFVSENQSSDWIKIYPNPVKNNLTIELQQVATVGITDIQGHSIVDSYMVEKISYLDVSSISSGIYFGLPFYQASTITSSAYSPIIRLGFGNYNFWNENVFSTFKVSISVIYGTNFTSVYTLDCYLNIYPYRLVSASQTSLTVQTNNLETNAINGNTSFSYTDPTYAPNGRYFWTHGSFSTGTISSGYVQMVIPASGYWGFQIKNPNAGNSCIISMSVKQMNRAIGGTLTLENLSGYMNNYNQGFGTVTKRSGHLGLPFFQASTTTVSAYSTPFKLGWSNYSSWNPNTFSTFKVSISVIHGTSFENVYTLNGYLNIYPYRLVSASQTPLNTQINNLE
nr:T9SS type A sorting domain-containing protein [Bacteroidota bacterium]